MRRTSSRTRSRIERTVEEDDVGRLQLRQLGPRSGARAVVRHRTQLALHRETARDVGDLDGGRTLRDAVRRRDGTGLPYLPAIEKTTVRCHGDDAELDAVVTDRVRREHHVVERGAIRDE